MTIALVVGRNAHAYSVVLVALGASAVKMLDSLTLASFSDCLGTAFRLDASEAIGSELTLIEAEATRFALRPDGSSSFSLIFLGALQPILPQRIYKFEHDRLGTLEIFIVPIGPDKHGMRYQAIFT